MKDALCVFGVRRRGSNHYYSNQILTQMFFVFLIYMCVCFLLWMFHESQLLKCDILPYMLDLLLTLNSQYSKSCLVYSFKSEFNTSALSTCAYSAARPSAPLNAVIPLRRHGISVSRNNGRLVGPSISATSGQGLRSDWRLDCCLTVPEISS